MFLVVVRGKDGFQQGEVVNKLGHVLDLGTCLEGAGAALPDLSYGLRTTKAALATAEDFNSGSFRFFKGSSVGSLSVGEESEDSEESHPPRNLSFEGSQAIGGRVFSP